MDGKKRKGNTNVHEEESLRKEGRRGERSKDPKDIVVITAEDALLLPA